MQKFPVDAPLEKVLKTLKSLGSELVREGNHIAMRRANADGTTTPLTTPNQRVYSANYTPPIRY